MSIEYQGFSAPSRELHDKGPDHAKGENPDLSVVPLTDLLGQIEGDKDLILNEYQKSCEYAVLYDPATNTSDRIWENVDTPAGRLEFRDALRAMTDELNVEGQNVFFCDSIYDIPLEAAPGDQDPYAGALFATPDGLKYRRKYTQDESGKLHMRFLIDTARLSQSEVRKHAERVSNELEKKGWEPGSYFKPFKY